MVAWCEERKERRSLCGQPACECYRAAPTLKARDALLEHSHRRVYDSRVGVAVLLEVEVGGCGLWVFEDVACGLENRYRPRTSVRVRALTSMNLTSFEAETA